MSVILAIEPAGGVECSRIGRANAGCRDGTFSVRAPFDLQKEFPMPDPDQRIHDHYGIAPYWMGPLL